MDKMNAESIVRQFAVLLFASEGRDIDRGAIEAVLFAGACFLRSAGNQISIAAIAEFISTCEGKSKGYLYSALSGIPAEGQAVIKISLSFVDEDEYGAMVKRLKNRLNTRLSFKLSRYLEYIEIQLNRDATWQYL